METNIYRCLKSDYVFEDFETFKHVPPKCPICEGESEWLINSIDDLKVYFNDVPEESMFLPVTKTYMGRIP